MIYVNARFLTRPVTGVERFAIEIAFQLKRMLGKDVQFLAPRKIIQNEVAQILDVKLIGRFSGHLWEQFELPVFLRRRGNSVLLNLCNTAPIFYRNKLVVLHDIAFVRFPKTFSAAFRLFYRLIIPVVLKSSRFICTVSEFSKNEISSYYNIPKEKICVVNNAVSSRFKPQKDALLLNEKYILVVSSVKENKNFVTALNACLNVFEKRNDLKLFVVGSLQSDSFASVDLSRFVKKENVKILGRVNDDELVKLYSNAEVFLFPSLYEGFGIPVLEAQACGCPVISSNIASMEEVLQNSALKVMPKDLKLWEKSIAAVCDSQSLKDELKEKGFANFQRFDWHKSACTMIDWLRNC